MEYVIAYNKLKKLFDEKKNGNGGAAASGTMYIDNNQIIGIRPKTETFENWFKMGFKYSNTSQVDIYADYKEEYTVIRVPIPQLLDILAILKASVKEDTVKIGVARDKPLMIETEDARIFLAPRV